MPAMPAYDPVAVAEETINNLVSSMQSPYSDVRSEALHSLVYNASKKLTQQLLLQKVDFVSNICRGLWSNKQDNQRLISDLIANLLSNPVKTSHHDHFGIVPPLTAAAAAAGAAADAAADAAGAVAATDTDDEQSLALERDPMRRMMREMDVPVRLLQLIIESPVYEVVRQAARALIAYGSDELKVDPALRALREAALDKMRNHQCPRVRELGQQLE